MKERLADAVRANNIDEVVRLLEEGVNINAPIDSYFKETALHIAAEKGHSDMVEKLILLGADINAKTSNEETPLHMAVEARKTEVISILKARGADRFIKNNEGLTSVDLELRAPVGKNDIDEVVRLVGEGANINTLIDSNSENTALHIAAARGYSNMVKELILLGADINAIDYSKKTPLQIAGYRGYKEIVEFLINNGADVNAQDRDGKTPLNYARDDDTKKLLLENGAKIVPGAEEVAKNLIPQLISNDVDQNFEFMYHFAKEGLPAEVIGEIFKYVVHPAACDATLQKVAGSVMAMQGRKAEGEDSSSSKIKQIITERKDRPSFKEIINSREQQDATDKYIEQQCGASR